MVINNENISTFIKINGIFQIPITSLKINDIYFEDVKHTKIKKQFIE